MVVGLYMHNWPISTFESIYRFKLKLIFDFNLNRFDFKSEFESEYPKLFKLFFRELFIVIYFKMVEALDALVMNQLMLGF